MKWAWKIGEIAGIGIYVHATFLILVAFVAFAHLVGEASPAAAISGIVFLLALFLCIFLHELGHALAAKQFGIKTRDITLLPIGGLARLERMPEKPSQELWVALAGPLVNVVIAIFLFVLVSLTGGMTPLAELGVSEGSLIERLMIVNVFLVAFNLLPAFPMDGGRVLRALLASRMDYTQATQIAAGVGQGMALLFGFIGMVSNPFLMFIALFVWIGAAQEASMVQLKSSLAGIPVERAMLTEFHALPPADTLADAVELTLHGSQQDFPVVQTGQVVGILTQGDLVAALQKNGPTSLVAEAMKRDFLSVEPGEMLETAFARLQEGHASTVPVLRRGLLVGLLTMTNLGEFLLFQSAIRGNAAPRPLPAPGAFT
jgi:Zn-dependent protease